MNYLLLTISMLSIITEETAYVLWGLLLSALIIIILLLVVVFSQRSQIKKCALSSRKSEEIKSSFLTHITAALRSPLSAINKYCDVLEGDEQEPLTDEERDKLISEIHKNSHSMFSYLNELQELTNFDGAVPALSMIEVNLAELIMSYRREILHETHRGVMVGIRTTMSPHCKATMDTTLFRQLIMHLLRVAAKRTEEGDITISYEWEREGLHCWIEDNGGGLADEYKGVIFKNLLPEDHPMSADCQSTAISLRICKSIIDSIHGTIEAHSSEEDKGVVISFWFPCKVKFS